MDAASSGVSDYAYRISRRRFLEISSKLIAAAALGVGLSGCTDNGGGEDKPGAVEIGNNMISGSKEVVESVPAYSQNIKDTEYGKISDPVKALEESQTYLEQIVENISTDEKAATLSLVAALPYSVKYIKHANNDKTMVTPTSNVIPVSTSSPSDELTEISKYVFNVNDSVLGNINKYLATGDKESEKYIRQFFGDAGGLDVVNLWRRQGVEIKSYGIPVAIKTGDENLMFLTSTFSTKSGKAGEYKPVVGDIRIMYRNISSDKEKPIWKPEKITDSNIYAPTGESMKDGMYYAGRVGHQHGWIDASGGIPLVREALASLGMNMQDFAEKWFKYKSIDEVPITSYDNDGRPERTIKRDFKGGKIIVMDNRGDVQVNEFKEGEYVLRFSPNSDDKSMIEAIFANKGNEQVFVGQAFSNDIDWKNLGLRWTAQTRSGGGNLILDGDGDPADGAADYVSFG